MSDQVFINDIKNIDSINIDSMTVDSITVDAYPVFSINGKRGNVILIKTDIGLDQIDNTSDLNKPLSFASLSALNSLSAFDAGLIQLDISNLYTELQSTSSILTPLTLTYSISSNILNSVANSISSLSFSISSVKSYAEGLVTNISPLFPLGSCYYAAGGTGANPAAYQVKNQSGVLIGYINLSWDGSPLVLIGVQSTDAGGTPLVHGTFTMYYDGDGNLTSAVCTN